MGLRPTLTKQISHSAQIRVFWCFCVTYKPLWIKHLLSPLYQRVEAMGAKTKKCVLKWTLLLASLRMELSNNSSLNSLFTKDQMHNKPCYYCKAQEESNNKSFLLSTRRANNVILPQAVFALKDTTLNATLIFRHFWVKCPRTVSQLRDVFRANAQASWVNT